MFFKAKLLKESKNGFKTISCRRYPVMFFSKNYFWYQKSSKKLDVLLIFEILSQEMCIIKTSSEKIDFGTSRICSKIQKILKTKLFFHALLLKHLKSGKMGPFIDFPIFVPIYVHKKDQFWKIWFQDFQNLLKNYKNVKNWNIDYVP